MKDLSSLLKAKYKNDSATAKRAQIRNEILIRGDEILAELGKGWSLRAIWEVLMENDEISCTYKTFTKHVGRLQAKAPARAITPKKERKDFRWDSTTPSKDDLI